MDPSGREAAAHIGAQLTGGIGGVLVANTMFDLGAVTLSSQGRSSSGL